MRDGLRIDAMKSVKVLFKTLGFNEDVVQRRVIRY